MRIFHVITLADLGGAQSVVINLAHESIKDGHEVYVVSEANGPMWEVLDSRIHQIRIPELQRAISPLKEWKVIKQLKKINLQYQPDIVHLHSSKIGILGRLAFPSQKIIYTIHGFDSIRLAFRKFLPLERMLQKRCRFIAAVSNYDLKNLNAEGITHNTVTVYNGIADWAKVEQSSFIDAALERLEEISRNHFVILTIARLSEPKRFDLFCEVAKLMLSEKDIKFIWIGNSYQPENIPDNVICLGEVRNAHRCLPFSNLFTLMSSFEGMPMSILEALAYSKPVVASDVGGISEVLNGQNGFAVANDAELFKEKISGFKDGRFDYAQFSEQARRSFDAHFTVASMYQSYKKLYQQISTAP